MFGKIIGTGSYSPQKVISNDDIAKFVETSDEWIKDRTGIERRHVMEQESASDMAVSAARKAIEDAEISVEDIDLIIVSSVSSDVILPSTACFVQREIKAVNAACFDMNAACTGFVLAYNTVQSYINTGMIKTALIIGTEGLSNLVDWTDRGTCILFGDGAGAAVIKADESSVFDTVMCADGSDALTCKNGFAVRKRFIDGDDKHDESLDTGSTYIGMDGQEVFRFAVKQVPICVNTLLEKMNLTEADIDCFVMHQANKRIIEGIAKRIETSMDKVPLNLMEYGNTSSASIPILLDELRKEGRVKSNDRLVLIGYGAGLAWSATYLVL